MSEGMRRTQFDGKGNQVSAGDETKDEAAIYEVLMKLGSAFRNLDAIGMRSPRAVVCHAPMKQNDRIARSLRLIEDRQSVDVDSAPHPLRRSRFCTHRATCGSGGIVRHSLGTSFCKSAW